jgi:hypothetical protein
MKSSADPQRAPPPGETPAREAPETPEADHAPDPRENSIGGIGSDVGPDLGPGLGAEVGRSLEACGRPG